MKLLKILDLGHTVPHRCRECRSYGSETPADKPRVSRSHGWCSRYRFSVHGNCRTPTCFRFNT